MTWPCDIQCVEVPLLDDAVHVGVHQVEARSRPPVAQQPRLDVFGEKRLAQQRVVHQVDLADREIVGRPPVGVDEQQIR